MSSRRTTPAPRLSRRFVLGGGAAAIALPLLDAMRPRRALADGAAGVPRRMLFYFVPNGIHMPAWFPSMDGDQLVLSDILAPGLAGLEEKLLVIKGLANRPAIVPVAGDHARGTGSFLTCRTVNKSEGEAIYNGISVDQVVAPHLCNGALFPSLQLGIDGGGSVGACDSGYSCAYIRNISWASPTTPLAKIVSPQVLFDRMFAGYDPALDAASRERRRLIRGSILDHVTGQATSLRGDLGVRDRLKLDEYLTGVRALEQRIEDSQTELLCAPPERPPDEVTYLEQVPLMQELLALSLECDLTRVASFMLGNGSSYRSFSFLGIGGAHHELSHHGGDVGKQAALQTIDTWEVEQLGDLLRRLDGIEEADGSSVLDNTLVYFSSEIADGDSHQHVDLPVLLAGGFGGAVRTGRYLDLGGERPLADLYQGLIHAAGGTDASFGDDGSGTPLALD